MSFTKWPTQSVHAGWKITKKEALLSTDMTSGGEELQFHKTELFYDTNSRCGSIGLVQNK